jgi:hypothetical protein
MSSKMNSNNNRQSAQNQNGKANLQLMSASEKLALLDDSDDEKGIYFINHSVLVLFLLIFPSFFVLFQIVFILVVHDPL